MQFIISLLMILSQLLTKAQEKERQQAEYWQSLLSKNNYLMAENARLVRENTHLEDEVVMAQIERDAAQIDLENITIEVEKLRTRQEIWERFLMGLI